ERDLFLLEVLDQRRGDDQLAAQRIGLRLERIPARFRRVHRRFALRRSPLSWRYCSAVEGSFPRSLAGSACERSGSGSTVGGGRRAGCAVPGFARGCGGCVAPIAKRATTMAAAGKARLLV